nr:reverse transcriptase domain-containing protein [Tanacetum cinerariifolium]
MNTPKTFPSVSTEDVYEEPLIVEAEIEGFMVRRVYVDEGASVEVMFEHCFENLTSAIKARLKDTQTDLVDFAREVTKPLGKIKLEVCFENEEKKQMVEGKTTRVERREEEGVKEVSVTDEDHNRIGEKTYYEDLGFDNLQIGCNLLHDVHTSACHRFGDSSLSSLNQVLASSHKENGNIKSLMALRFTISEHVADCEEFTDVVMRIGP